MKRQKEKKRWIILLLCFFILTGGTMGAVRHRKKAEAGKTAKSQVQAQEGQTLLTVSVQKMIGNEMTGVHADEVQTWMIPVGTDVVTKLGTVTTFARLDAGDVVQVLLDDETQEILKIWIVQ